MTSFLRPSQPPSREPSQPPSREPSQPASPATALLEDGDPDFVCEPDFVRELPEPDFDPKRVNTTPCNTVKNTPDQSKWASRETSVPVETTDSDLLDLDVAKASVIVPIILPDANGGTSNDLKIATHFAILVRPHHTKLFANGQNTTSTMTMQLEEKVIRLGKRRSLPYGRSAQELMVDCGKDIHRTRSGQIPSVQVRLLVSVQDLYSHPCVRMSGHVLKTLCDDAFRRMAAKPKQFSKDPTTVFFQNTFVACQSQTMLCRQSVLPPLRTPNGTFVTTESDRADILPNLFVIGWPDNREVNVVWYGDDRGATATPQYG